MVENPQSQVNPKSFFRIHSANLPILFEGFHDEINGAVFEIEIDQHVLRLR